MSFNFDKQAVYEAWLDMPFGMPSGETTEEAMTKPGNCVKSIERESNGFSKYTGRIVKFNDEKVVVASHRDSLSRKLTTNFVWTGTKSEYFNTWKCD